MKKGYITFSKTHWTDKKEILCYSDNRDVIVHASNYDGFSFMVFKDLDEAIQVFGEIEDVPNGIKSILEKGLKAMMLSVCNEISYIEYSEEAIIEGAFEQLRTLHENYHVMNHEEFLRELEFEKKGEQYSTLFRDVFKTFNFSPRASSESKSIPISWL